MKQINQLSTIELTNELEKRKSFEKNNEWANAVKQFKLVAEYLKGKDVVKFHNPQFFSIYRIKDYQESCFKKDTMPNRRWLTFKGISYNVCGLAKKFRFMSDAFNIVPIAPKKSAWKTLDRFFEFGEIELSNKMNLELGNNEFYSLSNVELIIYSFISDLRIAPESLFDKIQCGYKEQVKNIHDVQNHMKTLKTSFKRIPLKSIL